MKRVGFLGILLSVASICLPATAAADTVSVTQVITITARVADARSIVVNNQGQMVKIYSNTARDVTPQVFLNNVPGQPRPLTPELLAQYKAIMAQQTSVVGVAIPVAPSEATANSVRQVLFNGISSFFGQNPAKT